MPHEVMNEQQVAAYLHLDLREVVKLASRGRIPCRKVKGGFQFRKGQVDHWIESHLHTLGDKRLAGIERGVTAHHGVDHAELEVCPLIPPEGLAVPQVALPHPRHPLPYDIAESFIVVGVAPGGIPFGAEDGSLTRLFFLMCCKDDRTHLHVLARLTRMLSAGQDVERLLHAEDSKELRRMLVELEKAALPEE